MPYSRLPLTSAGDATKRLGAKKHVVEKYDVNKAIKNVKACLR